jgi:ribonucleoside-diphosphate reductase alpha chain
VILLVLNQILLLVKFKKLAGGGYFKIINQSIPPALRKLGYNKEQINEVKYAKGSGFFKRLSLHK